MTPVEEVIKEKTGVTLQWEYTKGSETEKVNQIFATQDLPDIYTGPAWGGELDGIIKAAKEGQLVDISDKLKDYPNLAKSIAEENVPPALYEKAIDAYDGKNIYFYRISLPRTMTAWTGSTASMFEKTSLRRSAWTLSLS